MAREELLEWLRSLPGQMISPSQLAKVTGGKAYIYNCSAKEGKLNLPYEWHGRNLRIWKEPVIRLIEGRRVYEKADDRSDLIGYGSCGAGLNV